MAQTQNQQCESILNDSKKGNELPVALNIVDTDIFLIWSNANNRLEQIQKSITDGFYILNTEKGASDGVVPLDSNTKIDSIYFEGNVINVLRGEYINSTTFNDSLGDAYQPSESVIYIDVVTNNVYQWTGVLYLSFFEAQDVQDALALKAELNGSNTEIFKIADGVANDDAISKSQLDAAISAVGGALYLQGNWDASTNTPDISGTTETGFFWICSVAGNFNLGGITDWGINDWAVKTDLGWAKVDNTDKVLSVAGKTGVVTLDIADISGLQTALDGKASLTGATFTGVVNFQEDTTHAKDVRFNSTGISRAIYSPEAERLRFISGLNGTFGRFTFSVDDGATDIMEIQQDGIVRIRATASVDRAVSSYIEDSAINGAYDIERVLPNTITANKNGFIDKTVLDNVGNPLTLLKYDSFKSLVEIKGEFAAYQTHVSKMSVTDGIIGDLIGYREEPGDIIDSVIINRISFLSEAPDSFINSTISNSYAYVVGLGNPATNKWGFYSADFSVKSFHRGVYTIYTLRTDPNLNIEPATLASTGVKGEVRFTSDYIYECVDTDTWKRTFLSNRPKGATVVEDFSVLEVGVIAGGTIDDYNPVGYIDALEVAVSTIIIDATANINLDGLTAPPNNVRNVITFINIGTGDLKVRNEKATSLAANRFSLDGDIVAKKITVTYEPTLSRWVG